MFYLHMFLQALRSHLNLSEYCEISCIYYSSFTTRKEPEKEK